MKKFIVTIVFAAAALMSFEVEAQRILTDGEVYTLLHSDTFAVKCTLAAQRKAKFVNQLTDVGNASSTPDKIKAVKDLLVGWDILYNGSNDPQIARRFLDLSQGKQFFLGTAPRPLSELLDAWQDSNPNLAGEQSAFEEFVHPYFQMLALKYPTSISSN